MPARGRGGAGLLYAVPLMASAAIVLRSIDALEDTAATTGLFSALTDFLEGTESVGATD